jgi:PilZ domain
MLATHGNGIERMTIIEQRKQQRYPLVRQPVGEFLLRTPTATYPIDVINDISSSGIQIYLDTSLSTLLQVTVQYVEPSLKVDVNGIVIWCADRAHGTDSAGDPGRFVIGIQLLSPVLLMAMSGTY